LDENVRILFGLIQQSSNYLGYKFVIAPGNHIAILVTDFLVRGAKRFVHVSLLLHGLPSDGLLLSGCAVHGIDAIHDQVP
jgi:hypothetical protein